MPLSRWTSKHRTTLGRKRKDDPQNKSYRTPPKQNLITRVQKVNVVGVVM